MFRREAVESMTSGSRVCPIVAHGITKFWRSVREGFRTSSGLIRVVLLPVGIHTEPSSSGLIPERAHAT